MARVTVAPALTRWMKSPVADESRAWDCSGSTVREVLDGLFEQVPEMRGYCVDELGALRHHVVVFVDGVALDDKQHQRTPVRQDSDVYIFQALSGG